MSRKYQLNHDLDSFDSRLNCFWINKGKSFEFVIKLAFIKLNLKYCIINQKLTYETDSLVDLHFFNPYFFL